MIILVIGPGSLTGSRFIELFSDATIYGAGGVMDESVPNLAGFEKLDITDPKNVEDVINKFPADVVINFAGATAVDDIEKTRPKDLTNPKELNNNLAYKINVLGTKYIIEVCRKTGKFPIFISTSFVFDGKNGPYSEEDPIANNPADVGWYAWTKILAEKAVQASGIDSLTLRISYPYRSEYEGKSDFARGLLSSFNKYPIFADQILTPTFIDDIPEAVKVLLDKKATGIFHLTSPELTTPYDFCLELLRVARRIESPEQLVKKGSIIEFQKSHPELAKRPIKGGEKTDKIQKLGFTPTSWKEGIKKAFSST